MATAHLVLCWVAKTVSDKYVFVSKIDKEKQNGRLKALPKFDVFVYV